MLLFHPTVEKSYDKALLEAKAKGLKGGIIKVHGNLECDTGAKIVCGYSSTITIDKLTCKDAIIDVRESSTVHIKDIDLDGTCKIIVDHSSTLKIDNGKINVIEGNVTYSSKGVCKADITTDKVKCAPHSRWVTKK